MMPPIMVINSTYKSAPGDNIINTTSRSSTWSRGLSPFLVGPVKLYGGYASQNMENAWQFSKVYYNMVDNDDNPSEAYFEWAKKGWADHKAHRYPAGKENKPLFSYWDGKKLDYCEARREIYIPLYAEAVQKTQAFKSLKLFHERMPTDKTLFLWDFDAHNMPPPCDYANLYNNPNIKFGHAYVLAMLLEGIIK